MIQAQGDPWLLRWDLGKTNFMDPQLPPAFLYYNPWLEEKRVTVVADLKQGRVHDLTRRKLVEPQRGKVEFRLQPFEARVIEIRT
jgi:hypothetical protein